MALNAPRLRAAKAPIKGAVIGGLMPGRVGLTLMAFRVLALFGLTWPAQQAMTSGIAGRCGAVPCVGVGVEGSTTSGVQDVLTHLPPAGLGLLVLGLLLFFIFDQLLVATGLFLTHPGRPDGPTRVWRSLWTVGLSHFMPFVRLTLLAAVLGGAAAFGIGAIFDRLDDQAAVAGATGESRLLMRALQALCVSGALALVGAFTFWGRVLTVADARRRVRRTAWHVLRVWARRPLRGALVAWLLGLLPPMALGFVLSQRPPWRADALDGWIWLGAVVVACWMWLWRIQAGARVYADPRLAQVQMGSDAPWLIPEGAFRRR